MLVAGEHLSTLYDDALRVLEQHKPKAMSFPVDEFYWNSARALIARDQGNPESLKSMRRRH